MAYLEMNELERAQHDLLEARKCRPSDSEISTALKLLNERKKRNKQIEKAL